MDRQRFEQIVEAYGADPKRWPEAERRAAEAFRDANSALAAQLMADAENVDASLDLMRGEVSASDLLTARILAAAPKAAAPVATWRPLLALAACAVLGVLLGLGGASMAPQNYSADDAITAAFGDAPEPAPSSTPAPETGDAG